jgi:DNA-binding CsgD family transcriptional regulator
LERIVPDTSEAEIVRRLDLIIALLLRLMHADADGLSAREQIATLSHLGMRPAEIARILGKTASYVNKELSGLRKRGD